MYMSDFRFYKVNGFRLLIVIKEEPWMALTVHYKYFLIIKRVY